MGITGELPEPIIQHIQYFLTSKEAAQTTLLSSSWCGAWLTRPNLDFDQKDFGELCRYEIEPLFELAEKTITRYENSNLKIQSFRISMDLHWSPCHARAEELIVRASKFGATRLSFDFLMSRDFVLPNDVFGSENLVALTVKSCKIDLGLNPKLGCSRLQSLSLDGVETESLDMLFRIISSFPLIEKLSLSNIFDDFGDKGTVGGDYVVGDGLAHLHRLTSLVLIAVDYDTLFLGELSSKFPFLKDLTLYMHLKEDHEDEMLISSCSLECLDLTVHEIRYGVSKTSHGIFIFDVPSIRKFTFEGTHFPSMSFLSTSRGWESHVTIRHHNRPSTSWFRDLSTFLTEMSSPRISLSLHFSSDLSFDYEMAYIQSLPTHEIENLTIDIEDIPTLSCYALLDALFRMCHPKLITQYASTDNRWSYYDIEKNNSSIDFPDRYVLLKNNNIDLLGQTLLKGLNMRVSTPCQFNYGLNDLKEVRAQICDEVGSTWRDVTLDALSDYSTTPKVDTLSDEITIPKDSRNVRFQLDWQP